MAVSPAGPARAARRARRQITEDALPRFGGQYSPDRLFLAEEALPVVQKEEKCFAADDRPADTAAELIAIQEVLWGSYQILKPVVGSELRILVGVEERAVKIIRPRTRLQPHLPRAAPHRCVHARDIYLN